MNFDPIIIATVTCFSTLLGGLFASIRRDNIGVLGAFSAGVLITTSLLDLLPETFKLASSSNVLLENIMALTVVGFLFLYVISRLVAAHVLNKDGAYTEIRHPLAGLFATSELSVHSFVDGLAIGFGFEADIHVGIVIAVAVICHDFTDGLSTVTVMLNSGNSLKNSLRMLVLDAVTPILGAVTAFFIAVPQYYIVLLLPFFSGGFLYLGASDLLPEAHKRNPSTLTVVSCVGGFISIFILTYVLTGVFGL
ncbi:ZIP family metal transporter [Candidatus Bathyarchaeota archaeon]|nr:ZIP family metal transporter [Candidatus Bathyarchaeota archaeon]